MTLTSHRGAAAAAALTALLVAAPVASAKHPPKDEAGAGTTTAPAPPAPPATPAPPTTPATPAAAGCGYTGASVFSQWNDQRLYSLTPDGGFEGGASGWTLDNHAAAGDGNETFQVGGSADNQSLSLPAGSSATSPAICVERHSNVFRFFARTTGDKHSRLAVEIVYASGRAKRVGKLRAGDAWAPTRKLGVVLGRAKGHGRLTTASVQIRFKPLGAGDWQIDDVYLDPRLRH